MAHPYLYLSLSLSLSLSNLYQELHMGMDLVSQT